MNEEKKTTEPVPTIDPLNKPSQGPLENIYIMMFRSGASPFNFKGFRHNGDLRQARNRAFKHGDRMNYKNIYVMPLVSDLDAEEKAREYTGETKIQLPEGM